MSSRCVAGRGVRGVDALLSTMAILGLWGRFFQKVGGPPQTSILGGFHVVLFALGLTNVEDGISNTWGKTYSKALLILELTLSVHF